MRDLRGSSCFSARLHGLTTCFGCSRLARLRPLPASTTLLCAYVLRRCCRRTPCPLSHCPSLHSGPRGRLPPRTRLRHCRLGRAAAGTARRPRVCAFTVFPASTEATIPSPLFRVLLLRRLCLSQLVAPRTCACRGRLNPLGDHRAACATSGVLASRALLLERAVARVCQEAGARVARNVRLADMNIDVPVSDDGRIEVVANGLSLWHGLQQVVDAFC